jgi:hypothetical protein
VDKGSAAWLVRISRLVRGRDAQYRIPDEQTQYTNGEYHKSSYVDGTSSVPDIAIPLLFLIGVWVVQPIVLLYILGEEQQACRRVDIELF